MGEVVASEKLYPLVQTQATHRAQTNCEFGGFFTIRPAVAGAGIRCSQPQSMPA